MSRVSSALFLRSSAGDALDLQPEGDVVEHGPVRQEPEVLEDHPDLPCAGPALSCLDGIREM